MIVMNNNLDKMIRAAGLQKKVVAERKGVTPETLSRHIHEKVPMTLRDAEDYAEILGCTPHQISYKSDPVKIVGKIHLTNDSDNNIVSVNTFELSSETNKLGYAYLSSFHQAGTGAVTWTAEKVFYDNNCIYRGLELEWATPILAVILRPDLRDVAFVDGIADF